MTDAAFSILNPLFMVYHSYVDYMLELKIRIANQDKKGEALESLQYFMNWNYTR